MYITNFLDKVIFLSNNIVLFNRRIVPYLFFFNAGIVMMSLVSFILMKKLDSSHAYYFLLAILISYLSYEQIFLKCKKKFLNTCARSYMQDFLIFIAPVFYICFYFFSIPAGIGFDVLGVALPLLIGCIRIGCFLGGCCYGIHSNYGVRYTSRVFVPYFGRFQTSIPGRKTHERVIPVQLFEAIFNFICFFYFSLELIYLGSSGTIIVQYFALYSCYRFFSDFFRKESFRPRIGVFSETQIIAMIVFQLCTITLYII